MTTGQFFAWCVFVCTLFSIPVALAMRERRKREEQRARQIIEHGLDCPPAWLEMGERGNQMIVRIKLTPISNLKGNYAGIGVVQKAGTLRDGKIIMLTPYGNYEEWVSVGGPNSGADIVVPTTRVVAGYRVNVGLMLHTP